ncbi:MAG TPA: peptidoglycan-binding domain-containing protein, partial [Paracoccaceae bacterium]|nr:peptidoglycan-binding domain-containing protein [Paracoccaceae bacterium]
AAALPPAPAPEELPRALQAELKRLGCYRLAVDGDWGNGSRSALRRYYDAKKEAVPEDLEPTEALWRQLGTEKDGLCPAPPPAPKAASAPKAPAPKTQPKAAVTKQEPAKKKEPTCRFLVVAIVCS